MGASRWAMANFGEIVSPVVFALTNLYGEKEIVGSEDNPTIIQMFNDLGYDGSKLKDETAWCAAAMNWCLMKTGHKHTGKLNARSVLSLPNDVSNNPQFGDIMCYWRESPDSWKGHTAFFIRSKGSRDWVLGGNQNNQFNIRSYQKSRRLGARRPEFDVKFEVE